MSNSLVLYRPQLIRQETLIVQSMTSEIWGWSQVTPTPTVGIFFDAKNALNFQNWWGLKRLEDGEISQKIYAPAREELLHRFRLTNELTYKAIPVAIVDGKLVEDKTEREPYYSGFSYFEEDIGYNLELAKQAKQSPNPDAAIALVGLMGELSRQLYAASWVIGNGYSLWQCMNEGKLPPQELEKLKQLHRECQGWWEWCDESGQLKFWSVELWQQ